MVSNGELREVETARSFRRHRLPDRAFGSAKAHCRRRNSRNSSVCFRTSAAPDTLKQEFIRRSGVRTLYMAFGPPSRACDCLAVNDKGNDRSNRFRDPKRIPDANRSEKPAE